MEARRAWEDFQRAAEELHERMSYELGRIDADHLERGVFSSSMRLAARAGVRHRYRRHLQDAERAAERRTEDALVDLGPARDRVRRRLPARPEPSAKERELQAPDEAETAATDGP